MDFLYTDSVWSLHPARYLSTVLLLPTQVAPRPLASAGAKFYQTVKSGRGPDRRKFILGRLSTAFHLTDRIYSPNAFTSEAMLDRSSTESVARNDPSLVAILSL